MHLLLPQRSTQPLISMSPVITDIDALSVLFNSYLANIPSLDVLQFNQQLLVTACLELLYEYPTVSRLLVQKEHKMVSQSDLHYFNLILEV